MQFLELWLILWMGFFISYAAWWDLKTRTVPNWLWLTASIPLPYFVWINFSIVETFFFMCLVAFVVYLRIARHWGMGDTKAVVWLGLGLGSLPAMVILICGGILAFITRRKDKPDFGIPFVVYLMYGFIIVYSVILWKTLL